MLKAVFRCAPLLGSIDLFPESTWINWFELVRTGLNKEPSALVDIFVLLYPPMTTTIPIYCTNGKL